MIDNVHFKLFWIVKQILRPSTIILFGVKGDQIYYTISITYSTKKQRITIHALPTGIKKLKNRFLLDL